MVGYKARDLNLLDQLDALPRQCFEGSVWRIVPNGRDPVQGYPAGARWDPGSFDVIYTSLEPEGSLAEIYFHLSRQPVFPSKLVSVQHQIRVRTQRSLELADLDAAASLGVDPATFGGLAYDRTQEIGDAAYFLGFDGLLVPSARWPCQSLVLFTDRLGPSDLEIEKSDPVDWNAWKIRSLAQRGPPS